MEYKENNDTMQYPYNKENNDPIWNIFNHFRKLFLSSIFLQTISYTLISAIYSAFIVYAIPSFGVSYENMRTFLIDEFNINQIIIIIGAFSGFFIVMNFQSGDNTYKFIWSKFEAVCNNIATYANDLISSYNSYIDTSENIKVNENLKIVKENLKLLKLFPYVSYYLHVQKFTIGNKFLSIFKEMMYSFFNPIYSFIEYFRSSRSQDEPIVVQKIDFTQSEYEKKILEDIQKWMKQNSFNGSQIDSNDIVFEFFYNKIKSNTTILHKKGIITAQTRMQMNNLMRSVVGDNGNISSTLISGRSKPQIEMLYMISIFYLITIPWILITLISGDRRIKWLNILFSSIITYFIIGLIISGNRLRNIFDFRSFQRPHTFKKHTNETSKKIDLFSKIILNENPFIINTSKERKEIAINMFD